MSIYSLKLPTKLAIDHINIYGCFSKVFSDKQKAITFINTITSYCCRNNLNGFLKTELITCVNNSDQVVFITSFVKISK